MRIFFKIFSDTLKSEIQFYDMNEVKLSKYINLYNKDVDFISIWNKPTTENYSTWSKAKKGQFYDW